MTLFYLKNTLFVHVFVLLKAPNTNYPLESINNV